MGQPAKPRRKSRLTFRLLKQAQRARRRAEGTCIDCGGDLGEGAWRDICAGCKAKRQGRAADTANARNNRVKARVALGFCRFHPDREAVPGKTLCGYCLEYYGGYSADWMKRARADAVARGDCSVCFKVPARKGGKTCEGCKADLDARKARAALRAALLPQGLTLLQVRKPPKKGAA